MSKITIDVKSENIQVILSILENLKDGLVENIEVDKSVSRYKPAYQPKANKVIKENEPVSGKYIDSASFKQRLKKVK